MYIYTSNESNNIDVFFDNLKVTHTAGHILEETHYYPFGLAMAGISTKALNNIAPNNYKFNAGNELNENFGINLYETFYRLQDVQTGRFLNTDPLAEKYYSITTYNYAGNNPINSNDPLGDQMKDYGRMQKGPDGNYHSGWVSEMMWNEKGFYNYGEVFGTGGAGGGEYAYSRGLYNIQGISSQSFLNQKQLFGDNATWNVAKAQFGYWRYNIFDPRTRGYEEAPANSALLEEVAVGTGKEWVAYETQSNWDAGSNWLSNLKLAASLTVAWALGVTPSDNITFENSPAANAMRNAQGVIQARKDYYNSNGKVYKGDTGFGLSGLFKAGIDPIEQFVGSYHYQIDRIGDNLQFTITNTTSFSSAAYHLWPYSWNWNNGPMGNTTQTYIFTEPYRK
ncbi:MAG: hypothetical protein IPL97_06745 [Niastella sp.]|nr:hypothetical protein [Niastella sp.]